MEVDPKLAIAQVAVTMINPELGPYLSQLPDELLIYIFAIVATTVFPPTSRLLNAEIGINPDTFAILNRHAALNRIRKVSKTFCAFFMQAFYESLHFVCKNVNCPTLDRQLVTSRAPLMPPSQMRQFLRTLRIEITLQNNYHTDLEPYPGRPGKLMRRRHRIESVEQLMAICPAARVLARLTDPVSGFCNLSHLDLVIRVNLEDPPNDEFLRVLEEANFVVKAKKVTLTVTDPVKSRDNIPPPTPLPKVQEKITAVETG